MVGIATFDSTIHFYNLKRALQQVLHTGNASTLLDIASVPIKQKVLFQNHQILIVFFLFYVYDDSQFLSDGKLNVETRHLDTMFAQLSKSYFLLDSM